MLQGRVTPRDGSLRRLRKALLLLCGAAVVWVTLKHHDLPLPSTYIGVGRAAAARPPHRVARRAGSAQRPPRPDGAGSPEEFLEALLSTGALDGQEELAKELRRLVAKGIHPLDVLQPQGFADAGDSTVREPLLSTFDLPGIAEHIMQKQVKKIVVMCGAGLSTAAGIPDFRTPGTGLYDNLQRYNLERAEMIFELDFFKRSPGAFYELCKEIWPGNYKPTVAHYFIKLLEDKGVLQRCYSQNIDSLECLAGLSREKLVAAHGNFDAAHVVDSFPEVEVDINEARDGIYAGEAGWQAMRDKFGGLVKPKIVFFGESLPRRFFDLAGDDLQQCDLLIVLGTSLLVTPFANLVGMANPSAPRLLVNRDSAGTSDRLQGGFRYHLKQEQNARDVWYQGTCDDGCQLLADALGWGDDLESVVKSEGKAEVAPASWL